MAQQRRKQKRTIAKIELGVWEAIKYLHQNDEWDIRLYYWEVVMVDEEMRAIKVWSVLQHWAYKEDVDAKDYELMTVHYRELSPILK